MEEIMNPGHTRAYNFSVKDPVSALTHFCGCCGAIAGTAPLLVHAWDYGGGLSKMTGLAVFMISMILLYGASASYHTFMISPKVDRILKKMDHMMIFILIAGSYTPVCLIALKDSGGMWLLALVWILALLGIGFKALWINCPKWVSSVIYIGMGWVALLRMKEILMVLPTGAFVWLLTGGILYTVGGVVYSLKLRLLFGDSEVFGAHELFHIFVMLGSFCHYMMAFCYLARM